MSIDRLKYYDLTHRWGHGMPQWPSSPGVNAYVKKFHAKDGVYEMEFEGIMHRGTHMDAPLHVTENTPSLTGYPLWRFFGTGVCCSLSTPLRAVCVLAINSAGASTPSRKHWRI